MKIEVSGNDMIYIMRGLRALIQHEKALAWHDRVPNEKFIAAVKEVIERLQRGDND